MLPGTEEEKREGKGKDRKDDFIISPRILAF